MNKRILLIALALVLAVACLTGCGKKGSGSNPAEGTWVAESASAQGMTIDAAAAGMSIEFQLKSDGKATMTGEMNGESESAEGSWSYKDGTGSLTFEGESVPFSIKDGKLVMEGGPMGEGVSITFKRK